MTGVDVLSMLFVFLLAWPILRRHMTPVYDALYLLKEEYRAMEGNRKVLRMIVLRVEPWFGKGILYRMDRYLRLAGRPWKLRGIEFILLEIIGAIGFFLLSIMLQTAQTQFALMAITGMIFPLFRIRKLVKKRQLEARLAMRSLKQRFYKLIRRDIPVADALKEVAKHTPGKFGQTLHQIVDQIGKGEKELKVAMQELRHEYEVREVDAFCLAIELSETNNSQLVKSLDRQIRSENRRIDLYIQAHIQSVKPKLLMIAGVAFAYSMLIFGYFAWVAIHDSGKSIAQLFLG